MKFCLFIVHSLFVFSFRSSSEVFKRKRKIACSFAIRMEYLSFDSEQPSRKIFYHGAKGKYLISRFVSLLPALQHNHGYISLVVLACMCFHRMDGKRVGKEFYSSPTLSLPRVTTRMNVQLLLSCCFHRTPLLWSSSESGAKVGLLT